MTRPAKTGKAAIASVLAPPLVALAFACAARHALAVVPDETRERRLAEEILPQLVVGDVVWLTTAHRAKVLALYARPASETADAVIVVHGLGVHPDRDLIGVLRSELADLGFATLSVQMPVLAADAPRDDYRFLFPDAFERLDAALRWLRAHGHARIAVVSHSLGAAMVNEWIATSHPVLAAWVPIGLTVDFAATPALPVEDVVAEHDFADALQFAKVRAAKLASDRCSSSVVVADTDHYFGRSAKALARRIAPFLTRAFAGDC